MKVLMTLPLFLTLTAVALANPTPVDRAILALLRNASEINIGLVQTVPERDYFQGPPYCQQPNLFNQTRLAQSC
jgi:hypothetical protein